MSEQSKPIDLITPDQAREILGVTPRGMRQRMPKLTRYVNHQDRRLRLLDRSEVEALMRIEVAKPRERVA